MDAVPTLLRTYAYGGCSGPKLASEPRKLGIEDKLETVRKPSGQEGITALPKRWIVERTFAWLPVPPAVEGLRERCGEFTGVDTAGGVPMLGAPNCPCQGQAKENIAPA
ncbi:MAG: hypothetical protein OXB95_05920 [Rhodobacteraceae bacterium]|nr:hypothetical protein [Paracoccaceae bacterium]